jgi:hypothetical protein
MGTLRYAGTAVMQCQLQLNLTNARFKEFTANKWAEMSHVSIEIETNISNISSVFIIRGDKQCKF